MTTKEIKTYIKDEIERIGYVDYYKWSVRKTKNGFVFTNDYCVHPEFRIKIQDWGDNEIDFYLECEGELIAIADFCEAGFKQLLDDMLYKFYYFY